MDYLGTDYFVEYMLTIYSKFKLFVDSIYIFKQLTGITFYLTEAS